MAAPLSTPLTSATPGLSVALKTVRHPPLVTSARRVAAAEDAVGGGLVLFQACLVPATVLLTERHTALCAHPDCVLWDLMVPAANKTLHHPGLV